MINTFFMMFLWQVCCLSFAVATITLSRRLKFGIKQRAVLTVALVVPTVIGLNTSTIGFNWILGVLVIANGITYGCLFVTQPSNSVKKRQKL